MRFSDSIEQQKRKEKTASIIGRKDKNKIQVVKSHQEVTIARIEVKEHIDYLYMHNIRTRLEALLGF